MGTPAADAWDEGELLRLMDVRPAGPGRYTAPAHGATARNVVEAGQLLGAAVVAASKEIPDQRVASASMVFSRAVRHDTPIEVGLDVPHRGRTYSTVQTRVTQNGRPCCAGLILMGADAGDLITQTAPMPDVSRPARSFERPGMQVRGRELRIVDDAYDDDPRRVGPPELFAWIRFADAPPAAYLHTALMTQSVAHWTIAAALRPHAGYSEAMAHKTISTGISKVTIAYHEDADVTEWLLYATRVVYTGRGTTQSEGRVYTEDERMVASFSVQGMIRRPTGPLADPSTAL
ncbi:acyl-CoA thioesterase [Actinomadura opuntiae]|uniref:acyl-CoA thioesterase n=1 Tax=Actinomadura sp. OS1-43 TaxID=604315 RepID=UPI00255B139D|nr:acyl-CoA thioesterase domain-containing protein [Actinomadura sp. OS1-43]MDL4816387.1 thioesterase family protein [Actinomadura sp. OS1-43]